MARIPPRPQGSGTTYITAQLHLQPAQALEALVLHHLAVAAIRARSRDVPRAILHSVFDSLIQSIIDDAVYSFIDAHGPSLWPTETSQRSHLTPFSADTTMMWLNTVTPRDDRPFYHIHAPQPWHTLPTDANGAQPNHRRIFLSRNITYILVNYAQSLWDEVPLPPPRNDQHVNELMAALLAGDAWQMQPRDVSPPVAGPATPAAPTINPAFNAQFANSTYDPFSDFDNSPYYYSSPATEPLDAIAHFNASFDTSQAQASSPTSLTSPVRDTSPSAQSHVPCPECGQMYNAFGLHLHQRIHENRQRRASLEQQTCPVDGCDAKYARTVDGKRSKGNKKGMRWFHDHLENDHDGMVIVYEDGKTVLKDREGRVVKVIGAVEGDGKEEDGQQVLNGSEDDIAAEALASGNAGVGVRDETGEEIMSGDLREESGMVAQAVTCSGEEGASMESMGHTPSSNENHSSHDTNTGHGNVSYGKGTQLLGQATKDELTRKDPGKDEGGTEH